MVPPVRFIPIAETNGLINLLGAWALKAACVQLRQFEEVARRDAVHLGQHQPAPVPQRPIPRRAGRRPRLFRHCAASKLVLEITEGTLMIDPVHAEAILTRMAERRARIAIDDFGTGYSSLAYLKRFPISVLKIDRAFIKDLPASSKDAAICNAVLDLAKHLGLSVVAEGVETEEQLRYVEARGCDYVQGYLTGKPMPAQVAMAALKEDLLHRRCCRTNCGRAMTMNQHSPPPNASPPRPSATLALLWERIRRRGDMPGFTRAINAILALDARRGRARFLAWPRPCCPTPC